MKKAFTHTPSSRSVSVRDIMLFLLRPILCTGCRPQGRSDEAGGKAFTLIELLVVVLIIGILSAIALPQYQKAVVKTRYAKQKALVRAIANAEEVYYLANSEYTLDVDSLDVSLPPITSSGTSTDRKYLYFSWGYCAIYVGAQNRDLFECTDNLAKISYAIVFNHSGQWAGKQRCTVEQTYVIGNEICKADSGLTNPTDTQDPVYYYVW